MPQETYTLEELADVTGLKPRTIRHYIQQHLLLGPDSLGRSASYRKYHRDRLEAVKWMRKSGFSIEEIRKTFSQAPIDEDIRLVIPGFSDAMGPTEDDDSALGFVQERQQMLMSPVADYDTSTHSPLQDSGGAVKEPTSRGSSPSSSGPIEQLLDQLRILSGQRRVAHRPRGETWVRFAATPDLEINVRGHVSRDQEKLFEQIADHALPSLCGEESRFCGAHAPGSARNQSHLAF